jgi:carboxymethylenebutenolidase
VTPTRVDVTTADGVMDVYLSAPDGAGPWPVVLFYMDAFGIRPELHAMAARLASSGFLVAVPNLYYRTADFRLFDPNAVAADGPERDRFRSMIGSITDSVIMRDTEAVLAMLAAQPAAAPGSIGAVGYCMGGRFALSAAGTFPDRVAAAASFHGTALATDKPDSPHRLAERMRARTYVGVAQIDPSFPPEQRQRLEEALTAAGVDYKLEIYDNAKHGFAVNGHVAFDEPSAERHWTQLVRLFRESLT